MKILILLTISFLYLSAKSQTRYQAESYVSQSGTTTVTTADPSGGSQDVTNLSNGDTISYNVTVAVAGIYKLAYRVRGKVKLTTQNSLGMHISNPIEATDSTVYSDQITDISLVSGTQLLTLWINVNSYTTGRLNWFEISTTNLLSRSIFEYTTDYAAWVFETCKPTGIIIGSTGRMGLNTKTMISEVLKTDAPCRAEIHKGCETQDERWYGFSSYMANGWESDPLGDIFFQLHEYPDFGLGETWRSPPIALYTQYDTIYLKGLYSALAVNTNSNASQYQYNLGKVTPDVWVDWVVHVKFAYNNTGILEVWKNGTKIVNRQSLPNSYNDEFFPYLKVGIYKWGWPDYMSYSPEDGRLICIDEVRVGNGSSSYAEVSPK